ncbi:MAG: hypothetical protein K0U60_00165 [Actinomycetia bacterium]|nr:hypothetical protein [Actinomycetes bacterium]MCH9801591.1 hypothetical protein [Actinomycetes bacterium]
MRPVPVVVAVAGEPEWLLALRKSDSGFLILHEVADPVDLAAQVETLRPRAVLLDTSFRGGSPSLIARLAAAGGRCVAVGADSAANALIAREWGLLLSSGETPELRQLLQASTSARHGSGEVIAVCGPTGSPGVSTIAANLAAELPELTSLIDADPRAASQSFLLGAQDEPAGLLAALAQAQVGTIDEAGWSASQVSIARDLQLATGATDPSALSAVAGGLPVVVDVSRHTARHTVVDCGSGDLPDWLSGTVATADAVVVVALPTALGVQRLTRWWSRHDSVLGGRVLLGWNRLGGLGSAALGEDPTQRLRQAATLTAGDVATTYVAEDDDAAVAMNRERGPLRQVAPRSQLRREIRELSIELQRPTRPDKRVKAS